MDAPFSHVCRTRDGSHDHAGKPFGDSKALKFAIGDGFQKPGTHVRPILLRNPTSLGFEQALKNRTSVSCLQGLVHIKVPTGGCIERANNAV